ncbi:MAG: ATP-binding protein [Thermoanaerobaculia bacterium]
MSQPRSLRQLLFLGTIGFAVAASAVLGGTFLLFESSRREVERDTHQLLSEQRAADEITTSLYGQILAAYQQLQAPGARNMERFDLLGARAYTRLRQYLFLSMTLEARLQVETIKEQHEALEVVAHGAFDLIARGESLAAGARVAEMHRLTEGLQLEISHFVALRERELEQLHEAQVAQFQRYVLAITLIGAGLMGLAIFFVRLIQRRVVQPLDQFAAATVKLASGDLAARIPPQRYSELEAVAQRFNEMADSIQSARTRIENQNLELSENLRNLEQAQQSLVQQEKLGAIGFMLAGLAHELNNPLAGILGNAECIASELGNHADPAVRRVSREFVTPLIRETGRAGDLVKNLLQFSRQSNTQPGPVALSFAVKVAAGLRSYAFTQAGKELAVNVPATLYVAADAQRLEHAVMNIMTNALEAMSTGGGTRLKLRAESTGEDWIALTFDDDGPGFAEPARVFDAFYTTKPVGSGTGLGLSLAQRFVTEAGGTISAENLPSGGARVTILLPAVAAPKPLVENQESSGQILPSQVEGAASLAPDLPVRSVAGPAGEERRILIVDDEPALRNIQRHFLARIGIRSLLAKNASEAIAILEREHCDAVITDIRMPGEMDGLGLYAWIEIHLPELARRCILVSGELAATRESNEFGVPPERVLAKPFTRDAYIARVLAVLQEVAVPS